MSEPITFACMSTPRLDNLKRLLPKVIPHVDRCVIVIGRKDPEAIEYLKSLDKMTVVYRPWDDNFANQWNVYLKHVKEGWVLIMDDDEVPSDALLQSLRGYVDQAALGRNHCCVEFRANPIYIDDQGKESDPGPANYWRQVFFKYNPGMHYKGGTVTGCHQYLVGYMNNKLIRSDHVYYHIKSVRDEMRNASRNYWTYGLWPHGSRDGIQKEEWQEMREVVKRVYPNVKTFMELDDLLIKGNVHPDLKEWMVRRFNEFRHTEGYNEMRALPKYYFYHLHPEENDKGLTF